MDPLVTDHSLSRVRMPVLPSFALYSTSSSPVRGQIESIMPDLLQHLLGGVLHVPGRSNYHEPNGVCNQRLCGALTGGYRPCGSTGGQW